MSAHMHGRMYSQGSRQQWRLQRNCCLTPRQLACAYAVPCAIPMLPGCVLALFGAWQVLAFALLEAVLMAVAFLHHARHVSDHELLELADGWLLVERVEGGCVRQQARMPVYWIRIAVPADAHALIDLEARGVRIRVGRFVNEELRLQVAEELRHALRDSVFAPARPAPAKAAGGSEFPAV